MYENSVNYLTYLGDKAKQFTVNGRFGKLLSEAKA